MSCIFFKTSANEASPSFSTPTLSDKIVKEIRSYWPFTNTQLQVEIEHLTSEELTKLVQDVLEKIDFTEIDKLAEKIPLSKLEQAVQLDYPKSISALQTAKSMFRDAKYFLEITSAERPSSLTAYLSRILDLCVSILESILTSFGIASLFTSSENSMESEFKGQKLMMLLSLFTMISSVLIPLMGAAAGGAILGGAMLTIAALSLIYPSIKPPATKLPRADNWSQKCRENDLLASNGREETLNKIARALIGKKGTKRPVMLIGKTGIGKTELIKAFVRAVENGQYPHLQGKQIHYINTADLLTGTEMFSNGNKILQQISETMGKHRDNYILIFDEIHIACQKNENVSLSEQLKVYLDHHRKEHFPYVIGITTEEEFFREIYVQNSALARRFKQISINNTTDEETLHVLESAFLRKAPDIILEQGALWALLQKTKDAFGEEAAQPTTSLKIFSECMTKLTDFQKTPLEDKVEEVQKRLQALSSRRVIGQAGNLLPYGKEDGIELLEEQLSVLENELAQQKKDLDALQQSSQQLAALKKMTYETVVRIQRIASEKLSRREETQVNSFLLQSHYLAPRLEKRIREEAAHLEVNICFNERLIDEVIEEELENQRKAQEMIRKGKRQIEAREAI